MIIVDAVAILDNEQIAVVILVHKEKFLKLVVVCERIGSPVKAVQSVVWLNPVNLVTGIYDIVNQVTG